MKEDVLPYLDPAISSVRNSDTARETGNLVFGRSNHADGKKKLDGSASRDTNG
jgi:hypothetical protein